MISALVFIVATAAPLVFAQSAEYTRCECYDYNIHCGRETWEDARQLCEDEGGWLATIDTQDLWDSLKAQVYASHEMDSNACHNKGFWIGFHDPDTNAVGDTGHTPDDFEWLHPMCESYENWANNEPNDNTKKSEFGQNCVQLWFRNNKNGQYDDEYCFREKGYICQVPLDNCSCTD